MKAALKSADGTFEIGRSRSHLCLARIEFSLAPRAAGIGAGPIGLGQLMLAKASGADVLIIDTVGHSLQVAQELGAGLTVNIGRDDPEAAIKAFAFGCGADIVFECASVAWWELEEAGAGGRTARQGQARGRALDSPPLSASSASVSQTRKRPATGPS